MREFWILLKVNLATTFRLNYLKKKFAKKTVFLKVWFPIISFLIAVLLLGVSFSYLFTYSQVFIMTGLYDGILYFGLGIGAILLLITNISKASSYLFEASDFDLLLALPIKPRSIIASKISSLLLSSYVGLFFLYLPTIIIYGIYTHPSILFYILAVISFLIYPLIIITISSIFAYGVNLVLARIKKKNIFQTLLTVLSFLLIFFGMMILNNSIVILEGNDINAIAQLAKQLCMIMYKLYYPNLWLVKGLNSSIVDYLLFLGLSIVPFLIFIYIVEKGFVKGINRFKMTYVNPKFILKEEKSVSITYALIKKELKTLFANANVFLNTAIGPFMSTIMLILLLIAPQNVLKNIDFASIPKEYIMSLVLLLTIFFSTIVTTTASSLSLEGRQFWILKSAPLATSDIFKAKILVNLIIAFPSIIINAIIIAIIFKANIFYVFLLFILPILNNINVGGFGLFFNILFPRFDWDNPVKVVKQSISVFLTMLSGIILTAFIVVVFIIVVNLINYLFAYLLSFVSMLLILILIYFLLKNIGVKRYNAIQI